MNSPRPDRSISIAVASGKGGVGKTTVATSLAVSLAGVGYPVAYLDCDVEEPNGHLFLDPKIERHQGVTIPVPKVDDARCDRCGICATACRYSAIIVLPTQVMTFPNLCHGCGACSYACPVEAITETPRVIGTVEEGRCDAGLFLQGRLDIGEEITPPVIRAVLGAAPEDRVRIIDAPPGTSCPVIETVKDADVALLVTEPTPFGLHDLKLAVRMTRTLGVPFAVAVNRADGEEAELFRYCRDEKIPVVLELPKDRDIACAYSRGETAALARPQWRSRFTEAYEMLVALARGGSRERRPEVALSEETSPEVMKTPSEQVPPGAGSRICELMVLSGKGGTGKTSVVASFLALAERKVIADCDVDASDLHLVTSPVPAGRWLFFGGKTASVDAGRCSGCGLCAERCRFDALHMNEDEKGNVTACVDPIACDGCGVCVDSCCGQAISLVSQPRGEWYVSTTRCGPMVHARLGIAQENSGRLVSLVRKEARALAHRDHYPLIISDGSPGVGCPVMASLSGAKLVLLVAEPTLSGRHDFQRIAELCHKFEIRTAVCINKVDLNPGIAGRISEDAERLGIPLLGTVRYDDAVTAAQRQGRAVVETGDGPAATDIRALWRRVWRELGEPGDLSGEESALSPERMSRERGQ